MSLLPSCKVSSVVQYHGFCYVICGVIITWLSLASGWVLTECIWNRASNMIAEILSKTFLQRHFFKDIPPELGQQFLNRRSRFFFSRCVLYLRCYCSNSCFGKNTLVKIYTVLGQLFETFFQCFILCFWIVQILLCAFIPAMPMPV